jgi:hypothetical protein
MATHAGIHCSQCSRVHFVAALKSNIGNNYQRCVPDHVPPSLCRRHVLHARRNESVHRRRSRIRAWLRGTGRVRSCSEKKTRSIGKIARRVSPNRDGEQPTPLSRGLGWHRVLRSRQCRFSKHDVEAEQRPILHAIEQPLSHGHIKPFCGRPT